MNTEDMEEKLFEKQRQDKILHKIKELVMALCPECRKNKAIDYILQELAKLSGLNIDYYLYLNK